MYTNHSNMERYLQKIEEKEFQSTSKYRSIYFVMVGFVNFNGILGTMGLIHGTQLNFTSL